jgi:hypothetical protein
MESWRNGRTGRSRNRHLTGGPRAPKIFADRVANPAAPWRTRKAGNLPNPFPKTTIRMPRPSHAPTRPRAKCLIRPGALRLRVCCRSNSPSLAVSPPCPRLQTSLAPSRKPRSARTMSASDRDRTVQVQGSRDLCAMEYRHHRTCQVWKFIVKLGDLGMLSACSISMSARPTPSSVDLETSSRIWAWITRCSEQLSTG